MSKRWLALVAVAASLLVVALDSTVLSVALPTMAVDLGATNSQLQWFADSYLLVLAALLLPAGMLGDRYGRKRLMLGALALFGTGSLWCAFAGTPAQLIGARAVLGAGAAVLIPLAMSSVVVLFAPADRGKAVSVLAGATLLGLPVGPLVAGTLLQHFWWGSVFLVNVPVIALALLAAAAWMPADRRPSAAARLDLVGVALSAVGLVGLTFGLIEGPDRGWTDAWVVAGLAGGVILLGAFLVCEQRTSKQPVMDLGLWRDRAFAGGTTCAALASFAFFGVMFVVPQYLHALLGSDAFATGLQLLTLIGGMVLGIPSALALGARMPIRIPVSAGFMLMAVAFGVGATTDITDGFGFLAVWTALIGASFGAALVGSQTVALNTLEPARAGAGSAVVQTMRQVGSVTGIAVLGAVLNGIYRSDLSVVGLPAAAVDAVRANVAGGVAVAQRLNSPLLAADAQTAFLAGMSATLWLCAGLALVAAGIAWLMPPVSGTPRPEVPADPAESGSDPAESGSDPGDRAFQSSAG